MTAQISLKSLEERWQEFNQLFKDMTSALVDSLGGGSRERIESICTMQHVLQLIEGSNKIVVVTGAGISVSAGVPDFRSENGLYATLKKTYPELNSPMDMFHIQYFLRNPQLFYSFAHRIYNGGDSLRPTLTHRFIRALEEKGKLLRNYTQNIDTLEDKANIGRTLFCHGSFRTASCMNCDFQLRGEDIAKHITQKVLPLCPCCWPNKSDLCHLLDRRHSGGSTQCNNNAGNGNVDDNDNDEAKLVQIRIPECMFDLTEIMEHCPMLRRHSHSCGNNNDDDDQLLSVTVDETQSDINGKKYKLLDICKNNNNEEEEEEHKNIEAAADDDGEDCILSNAKKEVFAWMQSFASFGVIKPDIVFFGESLGTQYRDTFESDRKVCDLLIVIGTSLNVKPVTLIPSKIPSTVPAILINRELVAYPRIKFDVNLLGDADIVCRELAKSLGWKISAGRTAAAAAAATKQKKRRRKNEKWQHIPPNHYLFKNGVVPQITENTAEE